MKRALLIILLLSSISAYAQFPKYYVYLIKNNAGVSVGSVANQQWHPLTTRSFLYDNQQIKINQTNTELLLIDANGHQLIYSGKGLIKVNQLSQKSKSHQISVSKNYFSFIFNNILQKSTDDDRISKENMGALWGGVTRDINACITLCYPVNEQILKPTNKSPLKFYWKVNHQGGVFKFKIANEDNETIFEKPVTDTLLEIDFQTIVKRYGYGNYNWFVEGTNSNCALGNSNTITILSSSEYDKKLRSVIITVPKTNDIFIDRIRLADKLGKAGFIIESFDLLRQINRYQR